MKGTGLLSVLLVTGLVLTGCTSTSESGGPSQNLTDTTVGQYSPAPAGVERPRIGCPPWQVDDSGWGSSGQDPNRLAADVMTTLATRSNRFRVIERAQLEQLLKEQGLEGIVKPGEMAQYGQVRGVDYLMLGKITNMRVKRETGSSGFGIGDIELPFGGRAGGMDVSSDETVIKVEMGVDLRMVDPESGEVVAAHFSDYERVDQAGAFGVKILGAEAKSDADVRLDEDSRGRLLRLAIDDAFRKMLPDVDRTLTSGR